MTKKKSGKLIGCRTTTFNGISHGCGSGLTTTEALDAAIAEAQAVAHATGRTWISSQVCPARCPIREGKINIPGAKKKAGKSAPKVVSQNVVFKTAGGPGEGQLPPIEVVRFCVAIRWSASVTCKMGQDDTR